MAKVDVLNRPIAPTLIELSLPMIFGIIAVMSINLVDAYFLGKLGTLPLAAISFTFPIVFTLGSFSIGLGAGTSSVVSQAYGSGDIQKVKTLTTNALLLAFLLVSLISTVGLLTIDIQFKSLGADADTLPLIREYMQVWYFGLPLLVVPMIANAILRAGGDTRLPSIIMLLAAIINIGLDPIFIEGGFGIPAMGMKGAAAASVVARFSTLVISVGFIFFKEKLIDLKTLNFTDTIDSWKSILKVGVFAAMGNMLNPISVGILTGLISNFGTTAVAGFGVSTRIEAFLYIPMLALSAAMSPFAGQNFGAKNIKRLTKSYHISSLFCLIWTLLIGLFCFWGSEFLAKIFSSDLAVIEYTSRYLRWTSFSAIGYGILVVFASGFNATGYSNIGLLLYAVRNFVILIPLVFTFTYFFNENGVYLGTASANIIAAILFYFFSLGFIQKVFR